MSKGDLDGIRFLGRAIKPVALGMSLAMLFLTISNIADTGRLEDSWLGDVIALISVVSFVLLMGGWWGKWQRWAELGLVAAFTAWMIRFAFLLLTTPWYSQGTWLSLSSGIIAGGAYLLEVNDRRSSK